MYQDTSRTAVLAAMVAITAAPALAADAPSAIVEDVASRSAGVELMDYVTPGQVITLAGGDTLTLGYLKSCTRELIRGGKVTIGPEQSRVEGGDVQRTQTPCDGRISLTASQAQKSGAMAFRAPPKKAGPPQPSIIVYALSPVIEGPVSGRLTIERLDATEPGRELDIAGAALVAKKFLDLAKTGTVLAAGGIYRVRAGTAETIFKIDPGALSGAAPLVGRLVRLRAAG